MLSDRPIWTASKETPVERTWSGELRITRIKQETPSVRTFRLKLKGGRLPFSFSPGQYIEISALIAGQMETRAYSISSSPTQRHYLEITIKQEEDGLMSHHLFESVERGNYLKARGPFGRFTFTGTKSNHLTLIAGGVGITPMMSMLRNLAAINWHGKALGLFSFQSSADILFHGPLKNSAKRLRHFKSIITLTDNAPLFWLGKRGHINFQQLKKHAPHLQKSLIFLCGPRTFMTDIRAALLKLGVPPEAIKTEDFNSFVHANAQRLPTLSSRPAQSPLGYKITFSKSDKTAQSLPDETILECAERSGVAIEYSCRTGTCGTCITKLLSGTVRMPIANALEPDEIANNYVLACQAIPTSTVIVEA